MALLFPTKFTATSAARYETVLTATPLRDREKENPAKYITRRRHFSSYGRNVAIQLSFRRVNGAIGKFL